MEQVFKGIIMELEQPPEIEAGGWGGSPGVLSEGVSVKMGPKDRGGTGSSERFSLPSTDVFLYSFSVLCTNLRKLRGFKHPFATRQLWRSGVSHSATSSLPQVSPG